MNRSPLLLALTLTLPAGLTAGLSAGLSAQEGKKDPGSPILDAIQAADADTRRFNEHIVVLSSPFTEGRLPGTRGMEIAKEYMEFWFKKSNLKQPFGEHGFRQPFPLSSQPKVVASSVGAGNAKLEAGTDFVAHTTSGGEVTGKLVSIGYAITNGRDGYNSLSDDPELDGKIAVILRGTPIGSSETRWRRSVRYSLQRRVRAALRSGAEGIILVTPSYMANVNELTTTRHRGVNVPVFSVTRAAADKLFRAAGCKDTVDSLAKQNDKDGVVTNLGKKPVALSVKTKRVQLKAENVAALLPGKGALAKELIVIGAHLDHLGKGNFGSMSANRGKVLHPGADDNASGAAGVLMIAEKMANEYAKLGDAPRRSVLYMGFSAEESGLNGSKYYVENQIEGYKCVLMINFDMIGRVRNNKVSVGGAGTAKGMAEWITKICDKAPIDARVGMGAGGGSDHLCFLRKSIPVLMGHSGQHRDYHTERDTADKINRVGAARVANLFAQIGMHAATWDSSFEFAGSGGRRR